eukprot:TRINITY_DN14532_c0_g1_i1.p1 TRINITY_DN14532_c0_g1~~TRINITY_DN14532_c0_g1_i1.p1  ORF type:complete len:424 (+),score=72.50 TRINITY_DN14532_c0_g1_i1:185-1456(+)
MPSSPLAFRSTCGCFVGVFIAFMFRRAERKAKLRCPTLKARSRLHGVMVGLVLTVIYFSNLLMLCGDIESNPGPPPKLTKLADSRQTRLTSCRDSSRMSLDSSAADHGDSAQIDKQQKVDNLRQTRLKSSGGSGGGSSASPASSSPSRSSTSDVEQNPGPSRPDQTKQSRRMTSSGRMASLDRTDSTSGNGQSTPPSPSPDPPTLMDVMTKLTSIENTMNCKFDNVEQRMAGLSEQFEALKGDVKGLRDEVGVLRQKNEDLVKENAELTDKMDVLERKTDDLEGRSKRKNLIFYGIPRHSNVTHEDCEGIIQDLLTDKLDITKEVEFDRVHRLNGKSDSPIIARCCFYKDKINILKEKRKLRGSNTFIGEDFSFRVREISRKLSPHLKLARNNDQRAFMVFDHLVIDGKKLYVDDHDRLTESR